MQHSHVRVREHRCYKTREHDNLCIALRIVEAFSMAESLKFLTIPDHGCLGRSTLDESAVLESSSIINTLSRRA